MRKIFYELMVEFRKKKIEKIFVFFFILLREQINIVQRHVFRIDKLVLI